MSLDRLASPENIYVATFVISVLSGLIPMVINIEAYLVAVCALSSASPVAIVLIATLGQVIAKTILYFSGRRLLKLPFERPQRLLERASEALRRHHGRAESLVLFSAVTGFPPFYGISILAGVQRMALGRFLVLAVAGRLFRFSLFALFPQVVKRLL